MPLPSVTMQWCRREAKCKWCDQPIETGTPMVTVFYWNRSPETHKRWNTSFYYHPQHWLDSGMDYLMLNPYSPGERRGPKPRLNLTAEERKSRLALLRKKATLDQRFRQVDPTRWDYIAATTRLKIKVLDCITLIAPLGGVPDGWLDDI
jgi:hypothetical protein